MATRHVTFEDSLYVDLVRLNSSLKHREFSQTVNLVLKRGLDTMTSDDQSISNENDVSAVAFSRT